MSGDEFVTPSVITRRRRHAAARPSATATRVIFYNYRGDRPRELTKAFVLADFTGFDRGPKLDLYFSTMTAYEQGLPVHVAYPKPPKMTNILGEYAVEPGPEAVPLRRDGEVPARDVLLQRLPRAPFPGEDRDHGPQPHRRQHLRPEAGDERLRHRRRGRPADRRGNCTT